MLQRFSVITPTWLNRATYYTGSVGPLGRDFRYRFQQDNENNTIKASVYSRICYEKATDVQEETFPWDEEGIARMRQWLQENYEAFCQREGIPEAAE